MNTIIMLSGGISEKRIFFYEYLQQSTLIRHICKNGIHTRLVPTHKYFALLVYAVILGKVFLNSKLL